MSGYYSYANRPPQVSIDFEGTTSKTKQAFKEEADINNIMGKYVKTGVLPQASGATFGDFCDVEDFQNCMAQILRAEEDFGQLPSEIRDRFRNDPGYLIDFLANPDNQEEAAELGLLPGSAPSAPSDPPDPTPEPEPSPSEDD